MNTEKTIEKLKHIMDCYKCIGDERISNIEEDKIDIIKLLKRGEKYEEMWKEMEKFHKKYGCTYQVLFTNDIYGALQNIKQKYFPKEVGK